jgi:hypothetical protein
MGFEGLSPELVWGLIPRFVGVLYVIAYLTIIPQHDIMPGGPKLAPIAQLHARIRRDMPSFWLRFVRFPSLLWFSSSDLTIRTIPFVGAACGALAIYGGPWSFYALLVAWMLWLSLECRALIFPWDTMLQEAGFLILFVPTVPALPELHASALPLPSVAFVVRWFVLRLMLGFGKEKFIGAKRSDMLYLRGFFVWMPLPTILAWLGHHAPAWALRAMLAFMFCAEVIAPVLGLFAGPTRVISFAMVSGLMLGIHFTGNWGFFNIGYIMLAFSLLDVHASIFDLAKEPWASQFWHWPDLAVHCVMLVLFLVSVVYLPNNSWFTRTWLHWKPDIVAVPHKWVALMKRIDKRLWFLRAIEPFRIVNGYGVFPPHAMAPLRLVPVFEGSDDGVTWKQYGYKHMPTFAHSRPPFIAPYHARWDQYTYYVTVGIDTPSMFGSLFPMANPYLVYTRVTMFDVQCQRLLKNDPTLLKLLGHNPFPEKPPKLVRVGIVGMTPTRWSEMRATGKWWHVQRFGTLARARGVEDWIDRNWIPEPEVFHPDLTRWKDRALPLQMMVRAHASGVPADQAVLESSDLSATERERLWNQLVPMLAAERGNWAQIHERRALVEQRFDAESLLRLERVLERYVWLLRQRTESFRFGETEQSLPPMCNFRYHMLMHEIVLDGREAFEAILQDPVRVVERWERSTPETQVWALTLLRYDQVMAHISTFRGSEMGLQSAQEQLPSFFEYFDLLVKVTPPGEEFLPKFIKHPDGEHTVEGFYPPPPLLLGDGPRSGGGEEPRTNEDRPAHFA